MADVVSKRKLVDEVYYNQKEQKREDRLFKYMLSDVLDVLVETISEAMLNGETVYLRGLGTFYPLKNGFIKVSGFNPYAREAGEFIMFYNNRVFSPSQTLIKKLNNVEDVFDVYFGDSPDNQ